MKAVDAKMAATLLEEASNEFSNHGCNDWSVPATPENIDFARKAWKHQTGEDADPQIGNGKVLMNDSVAMSYCAHLLEEVAGESNVIENDREILTDSQLEEMLDRTHKSGISLGKERSANSVMEAAKKAWEMGRNVSPDELKELAKKLVS